MNCKVIGKDQMEDPSEVPPITRWVYSLHLSNSSLPGSSWSASWRTTASSSRTETSTSTSRCFSLEASLLGKRRSTTSSFIFPSRLSTSSTTSPLFSQVTYKDFVSTALKLPSLLTCRGDLSKVDHPSSSSSNLQLVIDEEEPPIKA